MKTLLAFAAVMLFVVPASPADKCDCPDHNPANDGKVEVLVDKELSSAERMPTSGDLKFPKALSVCMFYDTTNKGYPTDVKLVAEGSLDGRMWFPLTLAGRDVQASAVNACVQVTPVRYVRVGWPPAANINSPGPRVTVQVQAAY